MLRLACLALLSALLLAACGGDDTSTVTETRTETATTETATSAQASESGAPIARAAAVPKGDHGPRYFETPSHNIGCYLSRHDARCDIRERSWSPPPEPASCKKIGLDYGQGLVVGPNRAEFVCAGDTSLGGAAVLAYRHSSRRGSITCVSRTAGITCRNEANGHGFFLSRSTYRLF
jgi:hypothetical protein